MGELDPAIQLCDVTFSYGGNPVLKDVSVLVQAGQMVSVVGPNGGGKTTFLKLCLGLLRPERGQVRVLGQMPEQARPHVGYVPQGFSFDAHFPITVLDVVLMGRLGRPRRWGFFGPQDRRQAREALQQVGLLDEASAPFSTLSGGQRQRVLIARALATQPRLLLLDEPTANVDPLVQRELHELLFELRGQLTVVLVTHDVNFVYQGSEQVICINRSLVLHPLSEVPVDRCLHDESFRLVRHDRQMKSGEEKP